MIGISGVPGSRYLTPSKNSPNQILGCGTTPAGQLPRRRLGGPLAPLLRSGVRRQLAATPHIGVAKRTYRYLRRKGSFLRVADKPSKWIRKRYAVRRGSRRKQSGFRSRRFAFSISGLPTRSGRRSKCWNERHNSASAREHRDPRGRVLRRSDALSEQGIVVQLPTSIRTESPAALNSGHLFCLSHWTLV